MAEVSKRHRGLQGEEEMGREGSACAKSGRLEITAGLKELSVAGAAVGNEKERKSGTAAQRGQVSCAKMHSF